MIIFLIPMMTTHQMRKILIADGFQKMGDVRWLEPKIVTLTVPTTIIITTMLKLLRQLIKRLFCKETTTAVVATQPPQIVTTTIPIPPPLTRCPWCEYWNDDQNNSFLRCAVHPLGIDTPVCPDFKNKSRWSNTVDFHFWEIAGLWGVVATKEAISLIARTFAVLPSRAVDLIWQWQEDNPKLMLGDLLGLIADGRVCLKDERLQEKR